MKPDIKPGDGPLLLAQPHGGTVIPDSILARLNHHGQARADTDWHISRLYADLLSDTTIVSTSIHRYVIDANRDPADESLYPGQTRPACARPRLLTVTKYTSTDRRLRGTR